MEESTQASHHRYAGQSGIPCATVYGLSRALPGVPGSLATIAGGNSSANLISASGDQDHAPSPSASACLRLTQAKASIASRLTFRDDWPQRPSGRGGMGGYRPQL